MLHRRSISYLIVHTESICIFCVESRYLKGRNTRESLTKCVELLCDEAIRQAATETKDSIMLVLVAAEANYHRPCYNDYIWTTEPTLKFKSLESKTDADDMQAESSAYTMLFQYTRDDLFEKPRVVQLNELTSTLLK